MTAAAHPFDWHLHLLWLLVFPALVGVYLWATRPRGLPGDHTPEGCSSSGGVLVLVVAVTWPLGDLAAHWLLMALVLQRLLLTLAVPPLLVLGTPRPLIARLTRPAAVDAVLRVVVRPAAGRGHRHRGRGRHADDRCGRAWRRAPTWPGS